jgi:acyl dehydratase
MATTMHLSDLPARVGDELGTSDWLEITQERIDAFADATDDHQWIHVDPQRAAEGPFGTTIAHGFLTLSLASAMLPKVVTVEGVGMGVNYGLNKVRFPAPVPVGSKIRATATLANVDELGDGAMQVTYHVVFEIEGGGKPACVAEFLARYYPG